MKFAIEPKTDGKFPKIITDDPHSLAFQLRCIVRQAIKEVLGETGKNVPFSAIFIEHPINKGYGDYSSNIAMIMAKRLKMKPMELAEKLKRKIDEYIGQDQTIAVKADSFVPSDLSISPKSILENVSVAGCGFLNLGMATPCLISQMERVLEMKYPVITSQMRDRKIAVEYTDPNPFKEFHLGHMYSNFIGEAIARLFEACGATVWRGDFYGDVGMHIAKSVYGLLAKFKDQSSKIKNLQGKEYIDELKQYVSKLGKLPISQRQKLLGEGYALGTIKYEEDKQVQEEVKEINSLIYVAAQEILKKDKGWQPIIDYKQYVHGKEGRLEEVREVYGAGLKWSLEYFETIYKRLG
ncbi:arginine--tRNA ligase, partial [Candidatus Microgenomates bacterium]|nr:arginine--tRNA ligase [Candidatus Microgenomates bacterium]